MSQWSGHSQASAGKTFHYLKFPSAKAFDEFISEQFSRLSADNRQVWDDVYRSTQVQIKRDTDWYGKPHPIHIKELENHTHYLGIHLLEKVRGKFNKQFEPYLKHLEENVMPRVRLAYNDRGVGVFSFDRAAMGLFRNPQVDTSSPISTLVSQLQIELGQGDLQTRTKKVFTHFENRNNSMPSLRLYVGAGANASIKGDDLLYIGLACGELVQFLEQRGVPVEVNVLLGSFWSGQMVVSVMTIKTFDQSLDKNRLLLLSSDPRYFRYKGFKGLIALANFFGLAIPDSLGRVTEQMYSEFQTVLDKEGFVFEQSYSLDRAAKEVSRIINQYENVRKLMGELAH